MENKKPIIIKIEETKGEIIKCINDALQNKGIPFYFLEMALKDIVRELQTGAKNDLEMAKKQYEEMKSEIDAEANTKETTEESKDINIEE